MTHFILFSFIMILALAGTLMQLDEQNRIIAEIQNKSQTTYIKQQGEINNLHKELTLKSQLLDQEKELAAKDLLG